MQNSTNRELESILHFHSYRSEILKKTRAHEGNIEVSTDRKMSFSYCYTSKDHLGSIWLYWNSLSNKYSNIYYPGKYKVT